MCRKSVFFFYKNMLKFVCKNRLLCKYLIATHLRSVAGVCPPCIRVRVQGFGKTDGK